MLGSLRVRRTSLPVTYEPVAKLRVQLHLHGELT